VAVVLVAAVIPTTTIPAKVFYRTNVAARVVSDDTPGMLPGPATIPTFGL
jgi:hypothetical protein